MSHVEWQISDVGIACHHIAKIYKLICHAIAKIQNAICHDSESREASQKIPAMHSAIYHQFLPVHSCL